MYNKRIDNQVRSRISFDLSLRQKYRKAFRSTLIPRSFVFRAENNPAPLEALWLSMAGRSRDIQLEVLLILMEIYREGLTDDLRPDS